MKNLVQFPTPKIALSNVFDTLFTDKKLNLNLTIILLPRHVLLAHFLVVKNRETCFREKLTNNFFMTLNWLHFGTNNKGRWGNKLTFYGQFILTDFYALNLVFRTLQIFLFKKNTVILALALKNTLTLHIQIQFECK
jgi:hypothetical protein